MDLNTNTPLSVQKTPNGNAHRTRFSNGVHIVQVSPREGNSAEEEKKKKTRRTMSRSGKGRNSHLSVSDGLRFERSLAKSLGGEKGSMEMDCTSMNPEKGFLFFFFLVSFSSENSFFTNSSKNVVFSNGKKKKSEISQPRKSWTHVELPNRVIGAHVIVVKALDE
jgi:hypothetical protein